MLLAAPGSSRQHGIRQSGPAISDVLCSQWLIGLLTILLHCTWLPFHLILTAGVLLEWQKMVMILSTLQKLSSWMSQHVSQMMQSRCRCCKYSHKPFVLCLSLSVPRLLITNLEGLAYLSLALAALANFSLSTWISWGCLLPFSDAACRVLQGISIFSMMNWGTRWGMQQCELGWENAGLSCTVLPCLCLLSFFSALEEPYDKSLLLSRALIAIFVGYKDSVSYSQSPA